MDQISPSCRNNARKHYSPDPGAAGQIQSAAVKVLRPTGADSTVPCPLSLLRPPLRGTLAGYGSNCPFPRKHSRDPGYYAEHTVS